MATTPSTTPLRWGILATGAIAHTFAHDLALLPDHVVAAAASRSMERARAFTDVHGGRPHDSYEALAADPDVDVVYVASPHGRHEQDARLCLEAGKHVLCEKALTLDAASGRRLADLARERGLFLAEAMWMRTHPVIREVQRLVADGAVGTPSLVRAALGFTAPHDVARLWEPELGASALLDIGIYPVTFAHLVLGAPESVTAAGELHERGFDVSGGATCVHAGGAVSSLAWTQVGDCDDTASIAGDEGLIEIGRRFHSPTSFTLTRDGRTETFTPEVLGEGYAHEAAEVAACLREGRTESALLPLAETIAIQEVMDRMIGQMRDHDVRRRATSSDLP